MRRKLAFFSATVLGLGSLGNLSLASTGTFTGPVTTAFLSVDLNGGPLASATAPTEGYNGSSQATLLPDQYGVTWAPWGGNTYSDGDGTQLPSSQSSPQVNASSITKTFGSISATISIDTTNNSAKYATVNGVASMNSRDRGAISGVTYLPPASLDGDMFRDFLFAGGSGSQVQGENYTQLSLTGLAPSTPYEIALYSFDAASSPHSTNWTATAPTSSNSVDGWWASSPSGNNNFTAPADEQTISWSGTSSTNLPAPATFTLTSSPTGTLSVWGFGGSGVSGDQNGDTTYLDGFQVAAVPEPATISLLGFATAGLMFRRRKNA